MVAGLSRGPLWKEISFPTTRDTTIEISFCECLAQSTSGALPTLVLVLGLFRGPHGGAACEASAVAASTTSANGTIDEHQEAKDSFCACLSAGKQKAQSFLCSMPGGIADSTWKCCTSPNFQPQNVRQDAGGSAREWT